MVRVKKMNESFFAKLHKDLTTTGELIRARQEEKEGILQEFNEESKRFFFGKISERALASSVKKTNKELMRLDKHIRENITRLRKIAERVEALASAQAPVKYRATLSGISGGPKKKKMAKKKTTKKKTTKKKAKKKK